MIVLLAETELSILSVAFFVALLGTGLLVTATRAHRKGIESKRRTRLGLFAMVCGPLVGATLAWLFNTVDDVNPLDSGYYYLVFTIIGGIAGLLAGLAFWMTTLLCTRDPSGKGVSMGLFDKTNRRATPWSVIRHSLIVALVGACLGVLVVLLNHERSANWPLGLIAWTLLCLVVGAVWEWQVGETWDGETDH